MKVHACMIQMVSPGAANASMECFGTQKRSSAQVKDSKESINSTQLDSSLGEHIESHRFWGPRSNPKTGATL